MTLQALASRIGRVSQGSASRPTTASSVPLCDSLYSVTQPVLPYENHRSPFWLSLVRQRYACIYTLVHNLPGICYYHKPRISPPPPKASYTVVRLYAGTQTIRHRNKPRTPSLLAHCHQLYAYAGTQAIPDHNNSRTPPSWLYSSNRWICLPLSSPLFIYTLTIITRNECMYACYTTNLWQYVEPHYVR